ncbi:MAG: ornithine-acyl-ACP acyltransferase [Rhodobacteraceae bacterium PARR1]|nr:MAG: ornithine-acyl-ACP acyltransferase [Rhodobacteraceae bacterium PARR1]
MANLMALRGRVFRGDAQADDRDAFDVAAIHVLVEESGVIRAGFRLLAMDSGAGTSLGYAAARYDLSRLASFAPPVLELGRFCTHPEAALDTDVLRLAWAFITREVDARGAGMLCGCTSFPGRDPARHRAALAHLTRHLAPEALAPLPRGADAIPFARDLAGVVPDPVAALAGLPPLLRTYLMMGGWVSDHAVPDPDLDTLHVFTAVEIAAIPPARARALRALAG